MDTHVFNETVNVATVLSSIESNKRDFVSRLKGITFPLSELSVSQLQSMLAFSSDRSFILYQIIQDDIDHCPGQTQWHDHKIVDPGCPYAIHTLFGKKKGPDINNSIDSQKR